MPQFSLNLNSVNLSERKGWEFPYILRVEFTAVEQKCAMRFRYQQ
jgi:hypothetical protein